MAMLAVIIVVTYGEFVSKAGRGGRQVILMMAPMQSKRRNGPRKVVTSL